MITKQINTDYTSPLIMMYIAAGCPFFMGTVLSPLLGWYGQQLAYNVGWILLFLAIIATVVVYKIQHGEYSFESGQLVLKFTPSLIILTTLIFVVAIGGVTFIHDRYVNPTEDYCKDIGEDMRSGASFGRAVVIETGQCIKTESGYHANGKAIFK